MLRQARRLPVAIFVVGTLTGFSLACDEAPPTGPEAGQPAAPAFAANAIVEHGEFSFPAPPAVVNAPCVDDEPLAVTGMWTGWYQQAWTADGHVHTTEHIDWSDVTLVATDGRTWKPGPGAHESFSLNDAATSQDLGESAHAFMHNLRARFVRQNGDPDLRVWHTIHVVVGPDLEFRVLSIVAPFVGECIGGSG